MGQKETGTRGIKNKSNVGTRMSQAHSVQKDLESPSCIGTTGPVNRLHIKQGANNATGGLRLEGSAGGNCWLYTTSAGSCDTGDSQLDAGNSYRLCAGCD